ncbi:Protein argonaute-2 [Leucoagaricus sp. SymC.cos]|nr:Protein argonaute-2 [Leucoagaricus sp. SymC.cos]
MSHDRPFPAKAGAQSSPKPQPQRGRGRGTPIEHNATFDSHVETVGVRRRGFGVAGREMQVTANFFKTSTPDRCIYHYDVITPDEKKLPARLNMQVIHELQTYAAPNVFSPHAAYDGRKNMFSIIRYPFGNDDSAEFHVTYPRASDFPSGSKQPKVYKVKLRKVNETNPAILRRFVEGKQSYDSYATTAISFDVSWSDFSHKAMNVVVRMEPSMRYTFNARSFFIEDEQDRRIGDLGNGLRLWQGYFQSVRPAINHMVVNIDIATGVVFEGGPLINLCLSHLKRRNVFNVLVPTSSGGSLDDRNRLKLQRFTHGLRILTRSGSVSPKNTPRILRKFTSHGANNLEFMHGGKKKTVARYYHEVLGRPLQYPNMICAEVGNGALIPLELCTVISGQLARQQVPPECARDMVAFASKRPEERLQKIRGAPAKLGYATSSYIQNFGMSTDPEGPLSIKARVLDAPSLTARELDPKKGTLSLKGFEPQVPRQGAWNMDKKKFHTPAPKVAPVAFYSLESEGKFGPDDINACFVVLRTVLLDLGITVPNELPLRRLGNPQKNVVQELEQLVRDVRERRGATPQLIIVILPEGGNDLYTIVKHFGDVHVRKMLSQLSCLLTVYMQDGKPCRPPPGTIQYYSNVALKINVKLGGINMVLSDDGAGSMIDPLKPTIIMGADTVHPAPGAMGKPSYTALVANVDSRMAKFVAETRIQDSRVEIIHDLKEMATAVLKKWLANRNAGDRAREVRLLFYRGKHAHTGVNGVSEGQFPKVLEQELAALKAAVNEVQITAKTTFVVVAKRHHVRFFPRRNDPNAVKGNCPPGTIVDRDVCHPLEFDFYLQSHAGILGTSRPAHYSVLKDKLTHYSPDTLQKFTYHLCFTYARATRAVSIPAPVYYADIVCSRAKNHYDPYSAVPEADPNLIDKADRDLELHRAAFRPLHKDVENLMYFSVSLFVQWLFRLKCSTSCEVMRPYLIKQHYRTLFRCSLLVYFFYRQLYTSFSPVEMIDA